MFSIVRDVAIKILVNHPIVLIVGVITIVTEATVSNLLKVHFEMSKRYPFLSLPLKTAIQHKADHRYRFSNEEGIRDPVRHYLSVQP